MSGELQIVDPFRAQMITPAKLAWVFDIGHTTVEQWNKRRVIPFYKHGRLIRYQPGVVLDHIVRHTLRARGQEVENSGLLMTEGAWVRIERLVELHVRARFEPEIQKAVL